MRHVILHLSRLAKHLPTHRRVTLQSSPSPSEIGWPSFHSRKDSVADVTATDISDVCAVGTPGAGGKPWISDAGCHETKMQASI